MPDGNIFFEVPTNTIIVPATTTSANRALPLPAVGATVRVVNNGLAHCRIAFGKDSTVQAIKPTAGALAGGTYTGGNPGSELILANSVEVFTPPVGTQFVAVATDSGTTSMEFTPGVGA